MSPARPDQPDLTLAADVVIIGGGLVGLPLAIAFGQAGLDVAVVDREHPAVAAADPFDGRGSAIAWGSAQVLRGLGLWQRLAPHAAPILDIRVSDGESPLFLHYDHRDLGADPLGYIIENRFTRRALYARLAELPNVRLVAPSSVRSIERTRGYVHAELEDGTRIEARLAVACDGRESPIRRAAGIRVTRWNYSQTGIVCSIRHERPHRGVAHERFLPAGPFAVLPLPDSETGAHYSSIVWTERADLAPAMMRLNDDEFAAEIAARFGDTLGAIAVAGPRWAYPLTLLQAERYTDVRLALAGDAAHVIHPIAGQGLNLGLRDVAALAECVVDARRLGLDIGAADVLGRYERWRRFDNLTLMAVTDGLNRLFSNDIGPIRLMRDVGLAVVDRLPAVKRFFMRHAMGVVGDLPRLLRGEAL
ncbi:MAG TPA: UbiH/UbiF/VisC/COQ6 family ubiquinone biosynthesis hydroxylase [Alphaproteobacteria bacterium]